MGDPRRFSSQDRVKQWRKRRLIENPSQGWLEDPLGRLRAAYARYNPDEDMMNDDEYEAVQAEQARSEAQARNPRVDINVLGRPFSFGDEDIAAMGDVVGRGFDVLNRFTVGGTAYGEADRAAIRSMNENPTHAPEWLKAASLRAQGPGIMVDGAKTYEALMNAATAVVPTVKAWGKEAFRFPDPETAPKGGGMANNFNLYNKKLELTLYSDGIKAGMRPAEAQQTAEELTKQRAMFDTDLVNMATSAAQGMGAEVLAAKGLGRFANTAANRLKARYREGSTPKELRGPRYGEVGAVPLTEDKRPPHQQTQEDFFEHINSIAVTRGTKIDKSPTRITREAANAAHLVELRRYAKGNGVISREVFDSLGDKEKVIFTKFYPESVASDIPVMSEADENLAAGTKGKRAPTQKVETAKEKRDRLKAEKASRETPVGELPVRQAIALPETAEPGRVVVETLMDRGYTGLKTNKLEEALSGKAEPVIFNTQKLDPNDITMEFGTKDMQGNINKANPAWGELYRKGRASIINLHNNKMQRLGFPDLINNHLESLTIPDGVLLGAKGQKVVDGLLANGFVETQVRFPDGSTGRRIHHVEAETPVGGKVIIGETGDHLDIAGDADGRVSKTGESIVTEPEVPLESTNNLEADFNEFKDTILAKGKDAELAAKKAEDAEIKRVAAAEAAEERAALAREEKRDINGPAFVKNELNETVNAQKKAAADEAAAKKAANKAAGKPKVNRLSAAAKKLNDEAKSAETVEADTPPLPGIVPLEAMTMNLSSQTSTRGGNIPGFDWLMGALANNRIDGTVLRGLSASHQITINAMDNALRHLPNVKTQAAKVTGVFGGQAEPSVEYVIEFSAIDKDEVLAAVAKQFGLKGLQEEVHVRKAVSGRNFKAGNLNPDGSIDIETHTINTIKPMTMGDVTAATNHSGLYGMTLDGGHITLYEPYDITAKGRAAFSAKINRLESYLKKNGFVDRKTRRTITNESLWKYTNKPTGNGYTNYWDIPNVSSFPDPTDPRYGQADLSPANGNSLPTDYSHDIPDDVATTINGRKLPPPPTTSQLEKLRDKLGDVYSAVKGLAKAPLLPQELVAYEAAKEEILKVFNGLHVRVERWTGEDSPYPTKKDMVEDILGNHLWVKGSEATHYPQGHPLGEASNVRNWNGDNNDFLTHGELLDASRDYFINSAGAISQGWMSQSEAAYTLIRRFKNDLARHVVGQHIVTALAHNAHGEADEALEYAASLLHPSQVPSGNAAMDKAASKAWLLEEAKGNQPQVAAQSSGPVNRLSAKAHESPARQMERSDRAEGTNEAQARAEFGRVADIYRQSEERGVGELLIAAHDDFMEAMSEGRPVNEIKEYADIVNERHIVVVDHMDNHVADTGGDYAGVEDLRILLSGVGNSVQLATRQRLLLSSPHDLAAWDVNFGDLTVDEIIQNSVNRYQEGRDASKTSAPPKWKKGDPPVLNNLTEHHAGNLSFSDIWTMATHIDGTPKGWAYRNIIAPVMKAKLSYIDELDSMAKSLHRSLAAANVKPGSEAAKRVGMYLDRLPGSVDPATGVVTPGARRLELADMPEHEAVVAEYLELLFKNWHIRLNAAERAAGVPITQEIVGGYLPHMWVDNKMSELFGVDTYTENMNKMRKEYSDSIGGPNSPHTRAREGEEGYSTDITEALKSYLPGVMLRIHMLEPASGARKIIDKLPPVLDNTRVGLTRWLDHGAYGHLTEQERAMLVTQMTDGNMTRLKKASIRGYVKLSQKLTRSTLYGSLGTGTTQFAGTLGSFADPDIGIKWSLRGGVPTVRQSIERVADKFLPAVMKNFIDGQLAALDPHSIGWAAIHADSRVLKSHMASGIENLNDEPGFLSAVVSMPNELVVQHTFNSAYLKATRDLNLSHYDAIEYADDLAGRIQAVYDPLFMSAMGRNKIARATFLQYQTWLMRNWNHFGPGLIKRSDISNIQKIATYAKLAGGAIAMNTIWEGMGLPSPFPGIQDFIPAGGLLNSFTGQDLNSGKTAEPGTIKTGHAIIGSTWDLLFDPTLTAKDKEKHQRKLIRNGLLFVPKLGPGRQIGNFILGGLDAYRGKTLAKDKYVSLDPWDAAIGVAFGPAATAPARARYDKQSTYLSGQGIVNRIQKTNRLTRGRGKTDYSMTPEEIKKYLQAKRATAQDNK